MTFYIAFFEMNLFWVYLFAVLGVARSHSNESTSELKSRREDTFDNLFDLFDSKEINLRRHHKGKEIWMWDLYCHLQPSKGSCDAEPVKRYYYDAQLDTCDVFNYTGCNGNQNNFQTAIECELRCKGSNFMGVSENSLPTVCYLQPDSGLCLAFITNYYFDLNEGKCKQFTFGGCGGNLNRFETRADCEEHCILKSTVMTTTTTTTQATTPRAHKLQTIYQ